MPPKETKHGQLARWRDGNANTITLTNANATSTPCILRVAISGAERSQSTPLAFRAEKRRKVVYTAERTQTQNHTMTQTRLGRPMTQTRLGRPRVLRKTLETKHVIRVKRIRHKSKPQYDHYTMLIDTKTNNTCMF